LLAAIGAVALVGVIVMGGGQILGVWDDPEVRTDTGRLDPPPVRDFEPTPRSRPRRARVQTRADRAARARWARSVSAICRRSRAESGRRRRPENPEQAAALLRRVARLNARYNAEILAVPAAAVDRRRISRLRALFAREERTVERLRTAALQGDALGVQEASNALVTVGLEESELLGGMGARDCEIRTPLPQS
jgi:hypothetical protein